MGEVAEGRGWAAGVGQFGKGEEHRETLRTEQDVLSGRAPQGKVGTG